MANAIGGVLGKAAAAASRDLAVRALIRRKYQEMRREIARLGAAVQEAERQLGTGLDDIASELPWTQASHQLRGWVLSLMESQGYIDSIGNAESYFERRLREVMAVAKRRAQAERLFASRS